MRAVFLLVTCTAVAVAAQGVDEEWAAPPVAPRVDAGVTEPLLPPPPLPNEQPGLGSTGRSPAASVPLVVPPSVTAPRPAPAPPSQPYLPPVLAPNRMSVAGALPLGPGQLGLQVSGGFPIFASLRALVGVSRAVDLGLAYETFLGLMHDVRALLRVGGAFDRVAFAAVAELGGAGFVTRATREFRGARWLTGRRNANASVGALFSYLGASPRDTRISVDVRYGLALDLEPVAAVPLGGSPNGYEFLHSASLRMAFEIPLSPRTSVLVLPGFDVRFSPKEAPFMPTLAVGFVTGL